jgi:ubiquinone/menaquinone biosynthesis C-methylase UbiE
MMGSDPVFTKSDDHYSYSAYADPAMAASFDAQRFGGPIGQILLEDQERVMFQFLGEVMSLQILDVGTGTGRAAIALARRGARVTAVDASKEMLSVARQRAADASVVVDFADGDVHAIGFADRAFDAVVCLRVLMHVPDWRKALSEMCRVSRHRLLLDFPSLASAAVVQTIWRTGVSAMTRNVEAYRVLRTAQVARELERHGFRMVSTHKQFVLPIAVHRLVGSARFTREVEHVLAGLGLLRLAGSPVTIAAERCAS